MLVSCLLSPEMGGLTHFGIVGDESAAETQPRMAATALPPERCYASFTGIGAKGNALDVFAELVVNALPGALPWPCLRFSHQKAYGY